MDNKLGGSEKESFETIYPRLCRIARDNIDWIQSQVGKGWNTSESKVVDNAFIQFVVDGKLTG